MACWVSSPWDGRGASQWPLGIRPVGPEDWCSECRCVSDMSRYIPSQSLPDDSSRDEMRASWWPLGVTPVGRESQRGEHCHVSDMSGYVPSRSLPEDTLR
jgi:hypothetical protein